MKWKAYSVCTEIYVFVKQSSSKSLLNTSIPILVGYEHHHFDGARLYNYLSLCLGKQHQDRRQQAKR